MARNRLNVVWTRALLSALLLTAAILAAGGANRVQAQDETGGAAVSDGPVFSIAPTGQYATVYASYTLEPGESADVGARISVGGTVHASLIAFVGNAVNPVNGGFAVASYEEPRTGAATWFTLDRSVFELDPAQQSDLTASVTVPDGTAPGQYIVGLVAQTAAPLGSSGDAESFGLLQIIRSAMAIEIVVPGDVTAGFELGEPEFAIENGIATLLVPVVNTGNVLVQPEGTLAITTQSGEEVVSAEIDMKSVYMGSATALQVILPAQFPPGDYLVSLELTDPASGARAVVPKTAAVLSAPAEEPATFTFGVSVSANGDPIRYADVTVIVENNGVEIPTATVHLHVLRDGAVIEVYPLATGQAIAQGQTTINQRYIPVDDWQAGVYSFAVEIAVVDGQSGTSTKIGIVESADTFTVGA